MSNFDHVSDLVAAREKIQNLIERLDTAKADVDKWKLTFDVAVRPNGDTFDLVVTATVGPRGTTVILDAQQVYSFNGDFESLSNIVAQKALNFLLKEQVEQELREPFVRACGNIVTRFTRSSL